MNFFTEIKEGVIISLNSIRANKVRSFLATLGIVIGIMTVTTLQTAIEGINLAFEKSISAVGADVLYIQKFEWFGKDDWEVYRNRRDINWQDYEYFAENINGAESVCPTVGTSAVVNYQDFTSENIPVFGTTEEYQRTLGLDVDEGRFFTKRESDGGWGVCVIGYDIKESFFQNIDPIGKVIQVDGHNFKVIGTYEKMGSMLGLFSLDNRIIIPINKFFKMFGTRRSLTINVKAPTVEALEDTKEESRAVMKRARRIPIGGKDDFGVNQQEAFKQTYESLTGLIKTIGTAITLLSLIVGSIGIANIMFVSVKERTKEIGIRKAIGAKRVTIMLQFLIEAVTICVVGGLVGLMIAFPLSLVINAVLLPTVMPLWVVVLALGISAFAGIVAGFFPALSASKLDPVDALRYE
ncbi:MAG TPA: ABC transporter permease [Ignavibacteria bacterium]|nr:ABC transporter permease [Ignavibacteria bacterium]HAX47810.1 peptide ABC transporter permease [Bacteroidota bacterium]HRF67095.1 ABC transporter permease [Ignavibacteria bacterium]HRJ05163.1 ABC transporter permease [Ignavibacteria bacterium]